LEPGEKDRLLAEARAKQSEEEAELEELAQQRKARLEKAKDYQKKHFTDLSLCSFTKDDEATCNSAQQDAAGKDQSSAITFGHLSAAKQRDDALARLLVSLLSLVPFYDDSFFLLSFFSLSLSLSLSIYLSISFLPLIAFFHPTTDHFSFLFVPFHTGGESEGG
jgi:hypothetical protein